MPASGGATVSNHMRRNLFATRPGPLPGGNGSLCAEGDYCLTLSVSAAAARSWERKHHLPARYEGLSPTPRTAITNRRRWSPLKSERESAQLNQVAPADAPSGVPLTYGAFTNAAGNGLPGSAEVAPRNDRRETSQSPISDTHQPGAKSRQLPPLQETAPISQGEHLAVETF